MAEKSLYEHLSSNFGYRQNEFSDNDMIPVSDKWIRKKYPTVMDAYEQYQMVLAMARLEEDRRRK